MIIVYRLDLDDANWLDMLVESTLQTIAQDEDLPAVGSEDYQIDAAQAGEEW